MSLVSNWEHSVYKSFIDLLKSKKQKISEISNWETYQEENPIGTRLINSPSFWKSIVIGRSFVTTLGQTTYENIALTISKAIYGRAYRNYTYQSKINEEVNQSINKIIKELNEGKRSPDWDKEVIELQKIKDIADQKLVDLRITMDLFIPNFKSNNDPFYAELKTPKPNKDQSMQTKQKLLKVYFSENWKGENVYLAFPYNPFILRENYNHPHIKSIFKIPRSSKILMGYEFWDCIGGKGTYKKILDLATKAGEKVNLLG